MRYINCHLVLIIAPATQAFKKLVKQPATKARRTTLAKSSLRSGAHEVMTERGWQKSATILKRNFRGLRRKYFT